MASMTWRVRYLGRGSQLFFVLLGVAALLVFAALGTREPCKCQHQSKLDDSQLELEMNAFQSAGKLENLKNSPSTPFYPGEQVFEDLKPENTDSAEDEGDEGMPDVMSNLSLADIKHITWGEKLDAEAFTAWAHFHVTSNTPSSFVLPEILDKAERACSSETELIILVPSVPEHAFIRELVRQTWAGAMYGMPWPRRHLHLKTSLVFVLGTDGLAENKVSLLEEESGDYGDLVTASFVDSYRNLTLKMITGLNWVAQHCPSASYILKCDLDTFVNLPLLTRLLRSVGEKLPRFVMGGRHEILNPPVLRSGRWGISKEDYPFPVYPPYVMGHSYVLTAGLAPQMVRLAHKIPTVPSEDSFITGVMACILKATRLYHDSFANNFKRPLPCNVVFNEDVSMTKMSMSHLLLMWRHVLTNSCTAQEIKPRGNMFTEKEKKKQQQSKNVNQGDNKKQQQESSLEANNQEIQQEVWKNPWEVKQIQEKSPEQLKFNPEEQLQSEGHIIKNKKEQTNIEHKNQGAWENSWRDPKFQDKVISDFASENQKSFQIKQNHKNVEHKLEQKLQQQEREILQQLL